MTASTPGHPDSPFHVRRLLSPDTAEELRLQRLLPQGQAGRSLSVRNVNEHDPLASNTAVGYVAGLPSSRRGRALPFPGVASPERPCAAQVVTGDCSG